MNHDPTSRVPQRPCIVLTALVGVLLFWSTEALGEMNEEQARRRDDRASELFEVGDYAAALAEMEEAQDLLPATSRVYNIAVCHERLGHTDEALALFREFIVLEDAPSERRARALTRIEHIQAERSAAESEPAEGDSEQVDTDVAAENGPTWVDEPAPGSSRQRLSPTVFWGLLGATAATTVVWAITGGLSLSYRSKFEGTMQGSDEGDDYERVGHALVISTDVFLGTSAALAVATLVVGLFTRWNRGSDDDARAPSLIVSAAESGGAIGLHGRF